MDITAAPQTASVPSTSSELPTNLVKLTPKAASMVKETMKAEGDKFAGLRIAVVGGGCSGFQYSLDLDEKGANADDLSFVEEGITCFVDPMSSMYLMGVEVDYVEGQFGQSGFAFKNPNAKHTCGCGSSFSA
ncbi:MAG: iron-sulfur cluster assembly accessory protein [Deltaproteobacteria bacterium]|nr:iron-sulfur cluster assembly accessory protein [Deltaproteobacteria bacterium]